MLTPQQIKECERSQQQRFNLMRNGFFIKQGTKRLMGLFKAHGIKNTYPKYKTFSGYVTSVTFEVKGIKYKLKYADNYILSHSENNFTISFVLTNVSNIFNLFFV